ncbi:MAG TPA: zinc ribbon domain-containing protein [Candidatus Lokiarchaeia archaeon]|nr:zinc ribbon domain-containing protein [Candidatus Lokiarchaeia archaeon]
MDRQQIAGIVVAELAISTMVGVLVWNNDFLNALSFTINIGLPAVIITLIIVAVKARRGRSSHLKYPAINARTGKVKPKRERPIEREQSPPEPLRPAAPALKPVERKITPEKVKTLEKLVRVSSRVKIDDMAGVLEVPRAELLRKLLDLSDQFHFQIEEEVVAFDAGADAGNFVKELEREFAAWGKSAEKTETAVSKFKSCPACGNPLPSGAKFCNVCGMRF